MPHSPTDGARNAPSSGPGLSNAGPAGGSPRINAAGLGRGLTRTRNRRWMGWLPRHGESRRTTGSVLGDLTHIKRVRESIIPGPLRDSSTLMPTFSAACGRQASAVGSAGDETKPVTRLARHVTVPSMRTARPSGTTCSIIRVTETDSCRIPTYPAFQLMVPHVLHSRLLRRADQYPGELQPREPGFHGCDQTGRA
jgi:hypothetical protein